MAYGRSYLVLGLAWYWYGTGWCMVLSFMLKMHANDHNVPRVDAGMIKKVINT
ncbi:hypothetical protein BO83DRAFT_99321 [Aspergillus eucalypticola CBS 122712]|uniref:Uncharacterized protein n=1 Tax=Aspergillus eucalypticola (strain CBS 122712 / IBT 29274) TaxID=1448314 RepID=A0A317V154_ASPEC|nr:uncharacterized protein BO83DRAFT_99321 [Aspergillus eucalypticola CBS 122712]PWY67399.1 hypothetical protein BO83DRAFT_99321 [Aspergillus eucalypticola CBS 122712]